MALVGSKDESERDSALDLTATVGRTLQDIQTLIDDPARVRYEYPLPGRLSAHPLTQ